MRKIILLVYFCSFLPVVVWGQFMNTFNYKIESGVNWGSGDYAPFWMSAKTNGLVSIERNSGYLSAGVFRRLEAYKKFSYDVGLELTTAYNSTSGFFIHQFYGGVHYNFVKLSIGSRERESELKNSFLSSGGMTFSGNARPIPEVRIEIPDYIAIPKTRDLFAVKAHVAYGRFTDDRFQKKVVRGNSKYTEDVLFHSKALFLRLGNDRTSFVFEGGFEMAAQFGGTTYYPNGSIRKTPSRFIDYVKVLIPMSGDEATPAADQVNVYGNHLGSWHFSFAYKWDDWKLRGYYEHFFEDHSQMTWEYGLWKDGLWGIEIAFPQNPIVNSFVYEFLGTKDQTGPFLHDTTEAIPDQISGNDNYYNHVTYSSWSHWGMGIGNPLLISPLFNKDGNLSFRSNRVIAHHIGFMGEPLEEIGYRVLFSHAKHWGTYYNPLEKVESNISSFAEVSFNPSKLSSWIFKFSLAADRGKLTGNNFGGMLTVKYVR